MYSKEIKTVCIATQHNIKHFFPQIEFKEKNLSLMFVTQSE